MDRRRFEAAHLKYAVLKTASHFKQQFQCENLPIYSDVAQTLQEVTPKLFQPFQDRYGS